MSEADRQKWDAKYRERSDSPGPPSAFLEQLLPQLPRGGRALDLACGDGANSLLLASRGWKVTAVDISDVGLTIGKNVAGPLPIDWTCADLDDYEPQTSSVELVLAIRYFDRERLPSTIDRALISGGVFVGECFHAPGAKSQDAHVTNPDYLVKENEWKELLPGYTFHLYSQNDRVCFVVAQKP